jgi:hypothetical protein
MGLFGGKTTVTTTTSPAPWYENFGRQNLAYADHLFSGVMNRYGNPAMGSANSFAVNPFSSNPFNSQPSRTFGGDNAYAAPNGQQPAPPSSFIAPFSQDTRNAFQMVRDFAQGSTPTDVRKIAGEVGGYRAAAARGLDPQNAMNLAVGSAVSTLGGIAGRPSPTFSPVTDLVGDQVAAQNFNAATVGDVAAISARQGADFLRSYMDPYLKDVVETSLADYDVGIDRQVNVNRARRDAGAAFGDRAALADAVFSADSSRGRGSLAANLRSQGFNAAAGFGMQDANRFLQADQTNQSVALQRALENARLEQAARQANASMAQQAALRNSDVTNDFRKLNAARRTQAELDAFNSSLANDQLRLDAAKTQAGTAQSQTLNQAALAERLTGIAGSQVGLLQGADEAEKSRIDALGEVGSRIDEHEQEILNEPLKFLEWRQQLLKDTPHSMTSTQVTKKKGSVLGGLLKAATQLGPVL